MASDLRRLNHLTPASARRRLRGAGVALVASLTLLAGCSEAATPGGTSGAPLANPAVAARLAEHGLEGRSVEQIIDALDRSSTDQRGELVGSVRQGELLLSAGEASQSMSMPKDKTYLSVAPYRTRTHDCFNHNLATCQGELAEQEFAVTLVDEAGKKIVDEKVRTYANGFFGLWLPRNITGTLTVTGAEGTGSVRVGTAADDPTCLTTLKLA